MTSDRFSVISPIKWGQKKYAAYNAGLFSKFIHKNEEILDIGTGTGWLAKEIQQKKNAKLTLLDVTDINQTDLILITYNGENIPFPNNSFDASLLIYVLHHCQKPKEMLKEARRVTREKIIVMEDTATSSYNKKFLSLHDIISNIPNLIVRPLRRKSFPFHFNFKTIAEWKTIFTELNLTLIYQQKRAYLGVNHTLFVLKI